MVLETGRIKLRHVIARTNRLEPRAFALDKAHREEFGSMMLILPRYFMHE